MQHDRMPRRDCFLPVLSMALWALAKINASAAYAQEDQYYCASFGSQESAWTELERDPRPLQPRCRRRWLGLRGLRHHRNEP